MASLWPTRYILGIAFGMQYSIFALHAAPRQSERFYDLTGSLSFIVCTVVSFCSRSENFSSSGRRQQVVSVCLLIWSGRLGYFLFGRINRDGVDRRFNRTRHNPFLFFIVWTLQGIWVSCVGLPVFLLNTRPSESTHLGMLDAIGLCTWAAGFALQAVADAQKGAFRASGLNKEDFISTGLWSISRHPNYLGEIVLQCGLGLVATGGLPPGEWALAAVSPVFSALLLTCLSGLPPLEKHARKTWGGHAEYRRYVQETAILVPYPSSILTPFRRRADKAA